ncbi:MAG: hypothetical protein CM1200mP5_1810 [Candidatus Pelagibacterales bacterium]|nr:MAG: hypothetical protein CM1200mP5_1810 [Pelagibacterales bacterium]
MSQFMVQPDIAGKRIANPIATILIFSYGFKIFFKSR